jgi:hypothetical protein
MSFRFVDPEYTGLTALEATELEEITFSGMFVGQEKKRNFRLGNLGDETTDFHVTASGLNSTIIDDVDFSINNGLSFETTVTVSGIKPNDVSDNLIVRYQSQPGDVVGLATFLIRVDEE